MHEFCPEGYQRRHPRHSKIKRSPLSSLGPNDEWSADGHDKLMKIGIAVYGFRDKASGKWLSLKVVPNNRLNVVITYLYLSLVEERGGMSNCCITVFSYLVLLPLSTTGMPLQTTTDCGSETTGAYAFGNLLRYEFPSLK